MSFSQENQYRCQGSTLTKTGRAAGTRWGLDRDRERHQRARVFPGYHDLPYYVTQATWSSPVSSRLLSTPGFRGSMRFAGNGQVPPDGLTDLIPVTSSRPSTDWRTSAIAASTIRTLRLRGQQRQSLQ
jgi:hypothetical protein